METIVSVGSFSVVSFCISGYTAEQLRRYSSANYFISLWNGFIHIIVNQKLPSMVSSYQVSIFSSRKSQPFRNTRKCFTPLKPYLKSTKLNSHAKQMNVRQPRACHFFAKIIKAIIMFLPTAENTGYSDASLKFPKY